MAKKTKPADADTPVATDGEKKEKEKEDRSNRRTAPVQIKKKLARMASVIASHRGIGQSDLLSPVLEPFLRAQYAIVQQEIGKELQEPEEEEE